jgi:hypothetical protein
VAHRNSLSLARFSAAAAGLCILILALGLPPRAIHVPAPSWQPGRTVVAGAFHVHTNQSDGAGSIDDVAAAAARAGLQFVIVADHGDGTKMPVPPAYRSGVLCLDGVEISTSGGHYVVAGMPQAPYPLTGEARDVVEDVGRLGGFGVAAHGDSAKPGLKWRDWDAPFDGLEWLNLDSAWRVDSRAHIARAFAAYWLRAPEALASLTARPVGMMQRWDEASAKRRVVGFAATDAHAQILWKSGGKTLGSLPIPSYEASFRMMTTRLELDAPLSGDAGADARAVLFALRSGHHYSALDALAAPPTFEFSGRSAVSVAGEGDVLPADRPVVLEVRAGAPAGARLALLRDGVTIRETGDSRLTYSASGARAVYRAEVRIPNAPGIPPVPWIVSNPIYVGTPLHPGIPAVTPRGTEVTDLIHMGGEGAGWSLERDKSSEGAIVRDGLTAPTLGLRYSLGPGRAWDQLVALVRPVQNHLLHHDRITLRASASHPLRLSVELRASGEDDPPRWQRSVYLDRTPRTVTILFSDLRPIARNAAGPVPLPSIEALMLAIDANNTMPGTSGEIVFSEIACER